MRRTIDLKSPLRSPVRSALKIHEDEEKIEPEIATFMNLPVLN